MAIEPRVLYPGQISLVDPAAYPYGKAINVSVPGDTTGTPLEEQWVNDLWGFLQNLLQEGSIVPSGNPDEVGASDYTAAVKVVAAAEAAALDAPIASQVAAVAGDLDGFEGQAHAWSAPNTFSGNITLTGGANGVLYSPARNFNKYVMPATQLSNGWVRGASLFYAAECSSDNMGMPIQVPLPPNATLSFAVALCRQGNAGAATPMKITGWKITADGASTPILKNLGTTVHGGSAGVSTVLGIGPLAEPFGEHDSLIVMIDSSDVASSTADRVYWVAAAYSVPGIPGG